MQLVACKACSCLHSRAEATCPFCGKRVAGISWRGSVLGAVAMGLTLVGCVDDGSSGDTGMATAGSSSETSEGTTMTESMGSTSMGSTTTIDDSTTSTGEWGEATYGVPTTSGWSTTTSDTGGDTDTDTDTDTDGTSSTSG